MNIEHVILDKSGREQSYIVPDCIPLFFNESDKVNNVGLLYFLRATRLLPATDKSRYDYFISDTLDNRINDFGDINISIVNINDSLDRSVVATIRLLD